MIKAESPEFPVTGEDIFNPTHGDEYTTMLTGWG